RGRQGAAHTTSIGPFEGVVERLKVGPWGPREGPFDLPPEQVEVCRGDGWPGERRYRRAQGEVRPERKRPAPAAPCREHRDPPGASRQDRRAGGDGDVGK